MCLYYGNLQPICYQDYIYSQEGFIKPMFDQQSQSTNNHKQFKDQLFILSRDFLIGLYKLLNEKQFTYQKKGKTVKTYDVISNKFYKQMHLLRFIQPNLYNDSDLKPEISP